MTSYICHADLLVILCCLSFSCHPSLNHNIPCRQCKIYHNCDIIMGTMASQIISLAIVYTIIHSGTDQRKHQISTLLAFVWGIHRRLVNSLHKWPVTWKMFQFDDVSMMWFIFFFIYIFFIVSLCGLMIADNNLHETNSCHWRNVMWDSLLGVSKNISISCDILIPYFLFCLIFMFQIVFYLSLVTLYSLIPWTAIALYVSLSK